jgi:protein TonB
MMMPTRIPNSIPRDGGAASDTPIGGDGDRLGAIGPALRAADGLPIPLGGTRPMMPVPTAPTIRQFRTSSMLQGSLIRRVEPVYPPLARSARIQGPVVLAAIISKAGSIERLQVLSGHPMLVKAAVDAVSQWRYRPYVLNGEVIEVETQITVNFKLN